MVRNINNPDENFYILLELDFNKPETNVSVIKNAIDEKEKEWMRNINHPLKGKIFSKKIFFIPEMKRLLLHGKVDIETTDKEKNPLFLDLDGWYEETLDEDTTQFSLLDEANAAKRIMCAVDDFITQLMTDKSLAELTQANIKDLVESYNRKNKTNITKEIVVKHLPQGIKVVKDARIENANNSLNSLEVKRIEHNLDILNLRDIYEFLGIPRSCSKQEMESAAYQKYSIYSKKPKTSENAAASELSVIAVRLARSDKREKYDTYLREKTNG